jgi:hypothetical protein
MAVSHEWLYGFTIAHVGVFRAGANFLNSARGNGDSASPLLANVALHESGSGPFRPRQSSAFVSVV